MADPPSRMLMSDAAFSGIYLPLSSPAIFRLFINYLCYLAIVATVAAAGIAAAAAVANIDFPASQFLSLLFPATVKL